MRYASSGGALAVALLVTMCLGQPDDGLVGAYKVDFAVPDMPAFKALGADPDNLLRPADPKALALMLADQTSTFRVIPQSFAVEFAPRRLFGAKKLTPYEYLQSRGSYDWRLSLGSKRNPDSTGGSTVAGGLRFTVANGTNYVRRVVEMRHAVFTRARGRFRIDDALGRSITPDSISTLQNVYANSVASESVDRRIAKVSDEYRDKWNRSALDVAVAMALTSPDSFTRGLAPTRYLAWVSWAFPLGTSWQGVVGGNGAYTRPDSIWGLDYSLAGRMFYGINEFKLHGEAQYKHDGAAQKNTVLISLGAEAMVFSGGWVEFTLDWENDLAGSGSQFVPGLKYHLTMPESFTKF